MTGAGPSPAAATFMTLFARVKNAINDEPQRLAGLAETDAAIEKLCSKLWVAASELQQSERRRPVLFATPVDPAFIAVWRDYEARYERVISSIWLLGVFVGIADLPEAPGGSLAERRWSAIDDDAKFEALAIEDAIGFAHDEATNEQCDYPEGFAESIESGMQAWNALKEQVGFDLQGVFRRRELIPFILVPRHVAARQDGEATSSIYTNLKEAHDTFVFGAPRAALILMRSILEAVLRDCYGAQGAKLYHRIENARGLPAGASAPALHRLRVFANAAVHLKEREAERPLPGESRALELEIASLLLVLRNLIEGAPDPAREM